MKVSPQPEQLGLVLDELLMLIVESTAYHRHPKVKAIFTDAQTTLIRLRKRLDASRRRHVVAVVGLTNVGKSTLLNALLGSDLAPRRNGPCTSAPVEFIHGPQLRMTALRHHSLRRASYACDDVQAIHGHLASLVDADGDGHGQAVSRVVVEVPHPLLEGGLVVADTPGFGAAQYEEEAGSHEQSLRDYLAQDVSQVFWVVLAEQGIGRREMALHDELFADVCDDVLVTGSEDWDHHDRMRFRRRFADRFGTRLPRFHFVSGLAGIEARNRDDPLALEQAGITALEARIRQLADPATRHDIMQDQLRQLAEDLAFWLSEFRDERDRPLSPWWRPDSWLRWQRSPYAAPFKQELEDLLYEQSYKYGASK